MILKFVPAGSRADLSCQVYSLRAECTGYFFTYMPYRTSCALQVIFLTFNGYLCLFLLIFLLTYVGAEIPVAGCVKKLIKFDKKSTNNTLTYKAKKSIISAYGILILIQ